jgi:hypothetical protein
MRDPPPPGPTGMGYGGSAEAHASTNQAKADPRFATQALLSRRRKENHEGLEDHEERGWEEIRVFFLKFSFARNPNPFAYFVLFVVE